ncbi:hypothetical protein HPB47_002043 [Ixodes persulcatus]|uniref:Uncharacterized protein n=1 Tax=Ixodes persulcatus TaxID=34615 RepID=A0AC60PMF7_IXOPE|nr:hypothetical protein HPB47_002043 [Ixodes persulcatus]
MVAPQNTASKQPSGAKAAAESQRQFDGGSPVPNEAFRDRARRKGAFQNIRAKRGRRRAIASDQHSGLAPRIARGQNYLGDPRFAFARRAAAVVLRCSDRRRERSPRPHRASKPGGETHHRDSINVRPGGRLKPARISHRLILKGEIRKPLLLRLRPPIKLQGPVVTWSCCASRGSFNEPRRLSVRMERV